MVFIRGALHLPENLGYYSIELELPNDYPNTVPLVYETGGKIKRDAEHHIFTGGNCCLFVEEETYKYYPKGTSIVGFIKKVVTGHFLNQKYFERKGKWIDGDRSHGIKGKLEFYREVLNTNDLYTIFRFIQYLAKDRMVDYQICFCGSKKKLGNCHIKLVREYRKKINPQIAKNTINLWAYEWEELKKSQTA